MEFKEEDTVALVYDAVSVCQICRNEDQREQFKVADITRGPLSTRSTDLA